MSSGYPPDYLITVLTRDDDHASEPRISAVIRLDEESVPYIVELTVRPADRGETLPHAVRDIDFEQLTEALLSTVAASARIAHVPGGRRQDKQPQPRTSQPRGGQQKSGQSRGASNQRPYRKMPPVHDVKAVFLETESVGKLATHFDVPRYTAQAWVDRLRRTGELEPPVAS